MSVPPPRTATVPLESVELPGVPTVPTSASVHDVTGVDLHRIGVGGRDMAEACDVLVEFHMKVKNGMASSVSLFITP